VTDFFLALEKNAERYPASLALASRSGHLTYQFLVRNIEAVAANAVELGFKPGQTVLLECSNKDARLPLVFGLMRVGVSVGVGQSPELFAEHNVRVDAVVTDNPKLKADCKVFRLSPQWFKLPSKRKTIPAVGRDYGLIFSSSGSTGKSKLIKFNKKNIEYRIKSKSNEPYFSDYPRFYSTAGDTTSATFSDFMITLEKGGVVIQSSDRSANTILDTINLFEPNYVTMAPALLVQILRLLQDQPRRFQKIGYLRLTGAYCSVRTREETLRKFAREVVTSFGAAEIARVASGKFTDIRNLEGSVGKITDGMIVDTVDDDGASLPAGSEGEIRVRPPRAAVASYLNGSGDQTPLRDGWFYPGDIGWVDPDGNLIITGRKSQIINLGGNKVSPEVAESLLLEMGAVEDVGVLGVKDHNGFDVVCAVIVKKKDIDLDKIKQHLFEKKSNFSVKKLKLVPSIPRTETGKIDRTRLKEIVD